MRVASKMNSYMRKQCKSINNKLVEDSKPLKHKSKKVNTNVVKMKDVTKNKHKRRVIAKPEIAIERFPIMYIGFWCMIIYYLVQLF